MGLIVRWLIVWLLNVICLNFVLSTLCGNKSYTPCGDNICCCNKAKVRATCLFWDEGLYLPKLPETIQKLTIKNFTLNYISSETFSNTSILNLQELQLEHTEIETIDEDTFDRMKRLSTLKLTRNKKFNTNTLWKAFKSLANLTTIALNDTGLKNIPDYAFNMLNKSKVAELTLSNNLLQDFNFTVLRGFVTLAQLNLNGNTLTTFYESVLLENLRSLSMKENRLSEYPKNLCLYGEEKSFFPRLVFLDLSYNLIRDLLPDAIGCLKRLQSLNLNGNIIQTIENNVFSDLPHLIKLQVAKMQCSFKEIKPRAFESLSLSSLNMKMNNIKFRKIYLRNSSAVNIFDFCTNLTILDMSLNSFINMNNSVISRILSPLRYLRTLHMVSANLHEIPHPVNNHTIAIQKLILDGNGIQHMNGSFKGMPLLSHLSLQGNNIRVVREEDFPSNLRQTLKEINLGDNPFDCSCDMLWFRNWIDSNKKEPKKMQVKLLNWSHRYQCRTPSNLNNETFIRFHPTKEECTYHNPFSIVYIVSGTIVLVTIITSLILYRNRWYIKYVFYKVKIRQRKNIPEQIPLLRQDLQRVDGYVIYDDEDSDYVHNDLIELAEQKLKYNLHVWHRDASTGSKMQVMVEGIYNSDNVLAVISNNFLKDSWCQFQLTVALDRQVELKRDHVMLIILEDVDLKSLSRYWCVVFTKTPSAYWCHTTGDMKRNVFEQKIIQHFAKHV